MEDNIISKLLEYVMGNLWVVIIVVGFFFNFIRRLKGDVTEPTTPIPMPDPFKQFHQDIQKETPPPVEREEIYVETEPALEQANPYYEKFIQMQERTNSTAVSKTNVVSENKVVSTPKRKITNNKVVAGVIWSEVLGPPRAKKPYYPRNNR